MPNFVRYVKYGDIYSEVRDPGSLKRISASADLGFILLGHSSAAGN